MDVNKLNRERHLHPCICEVALFNQMLSLQNEQAALNRLPNR